MLASARRAARTALPTAAPASPPPPTTPWLAVGSRAASTDQAVPQVQAAEPQVRSNGWVLLIPAGIAGFLGVWQLQRRQWKVDLVEKRTAALTAPPVPLFSEGGTPPEYSRVTCAGELQHDAAMYIGPRPRSFMGSAKPGFVQITPLVAPEWGRGALINRGWVPAQWRADPAARAPHEPSGQVAVEGIVRRSEAPSMFVPANDPAAGQWFWVDVPALASAAGLPPDTPLVEEVMGNDAPPGAAQQLPLRRRAADLLNFPVTPAEHFNYAATWFLLSAFTASLGVRAMRQGKRHRAQQHT